jgi:hypothetical protein
MAMSRNVELKLAADFGRSIEHLINTFISNNETKLSIGTFNIEKEPWRILTANSFRRLGLKINLTKKENAVNRGDVEIWLMK